MRCLSGVNPRKASGPDSVKGRVLHECSSQLGTLFTRLFQLFLNMQFVPKAWKSSVIIPVAKKTNAKLLNDFRPLCLTSILCKCMERIVCKQLVASVADRMDPLQFAYRAKKGGGGWNINTTKYGLSALGCDRNLCSNPFHGLFVSITFC